MLSKLRTTLFFEERLANCLDVHPSRASACLPTVRLVKWTGPDLSAVVLAVMLRPAGPVAQQRVPLDAWAFLRFTSLPPFNGAHCVLAPLVAGGPCKND